MLERQKSRKKRKNEKSSDTNANQPQIGASGIPISPKSEQKDEEFEGIDIKVYAKTHNMSVTEVWRKIHTGKLLARSEKGKLLIYKEAPVSTPKFKLEKKSESTLPEISVREISKQPVFNTDH